MEKRFHLLNVRRTTPFLHRDCNLWGNRVVVHDSSTRNVVQFLHVNHLKITAIKRRLGRTFAGPKLMKNWKVAHNAVNSDKKTGISTRGTRSRLDKTRTAPKPRAHNFAGTVGGKSFLLGWLYFPSGTR